jgi:hypothetical protein
MQKLLITCALLATVLGFAVAKEKPEYRYYMAYASWDDETSRDVAQIGSDLRKGKVTLSAALERARTLLQITRHFEADLGREPTSAFHTQTARLLQHEHERIQKMVEAITQEQAHGQALARSTWAAELKLADARNQDMRTIEILRSQTPVNVPAGTLLQRLSVLPGAHGPVSLEVRAVEARRGSPSARLFALDGRGKIVWQGPTSYGPLAFSSFYEAGWDRIDIAGPLGHDGTSYLVREDPQSDVHATGFVLGRWRNGYQVVHEGCLMSADSKLFRWTANSRSRDTGEWISGFRGLLDDGSAVVDVQVERQLDPPMHGVGTAVVTPTQGGFKVLRWISSVGDSNAF